MTADASSPPVGQPELTRLLELFAHVAEASDDARELTNWLLRQVSGLTEWPLAHALLIDPHGAMTSWFSCRNTEPRWEGYVLAADGIAMRTPTGLLDRVIATRRPGWVSDIDAEADYPRAAAARAAGLRGVFAFPVIRGDHVVAVLQFLSAEPIHPDDDFLDAMSIAGFLLGTAFDRVRLRGESVDQPSRLHHIMDAGAGSLLAVDRDGRVAEWTHGAERLFGWTRVEAMYRTGVDLLKLPAPSTNPSDRRQEAVLQRRDGSTFPAEVTQWPVPDGADLRYYIVCRDISERDQRRAGVTIDPLTGLLNRAGMVDRLAERLSRWAGGGDARPALLLLIGLQRFKEIDYSTHHHLADEALRIIGARIAAFARQASSDPSTAASSKEGTALVARVAGDEFAILLDSPGTAGDIARLAEAAADTVSEPFQAGGRRLALTAHVGAAEPQTGSDARSWFGDADAALYRSRHGAGAHFEIEGFARRHGASWRGGLPDEMRAALREGQFELYYQPIFALPERALTGAEALIRWHHPQHGLLLPGAFIDAAEGSGMIAPIGEWVLREAARQLRDWDAAGLRIAVNLGAQQLADPGIVARVIDAVHTVGAASPGGGLTVEMTESVLMTDPAVAATRIGQFRDKGVQVSIDDFGTGYSSLAYLKWFDVDVLKIDMSFVHGLESNRTDAVIVRTIIDLARELNLRVIAEGVETEAQLARLTEWGCTHVQGFGLGRPAPASALTARLQAVR